jgi:hypothetical protein
MKFFYKIIFFSFLLTACKKQEPELVIVKASAYVDGNKVAANFALIDTYRHNVINSEHTIADYMASIPVHAQFSTTDFSEKIITGQYTLVVQLKEGAYGALPNTYSYINITTQGESAKTVYVMHFSKTKQSLYQPWFEVK